MFLNTASVKIASFGMFQPPENPMIGEQLLCKFEYEDEEDNENNTTTESPVVVKVKRIFFPKLL